MNWYWHLLDWVPYRSPVAMFVLGLGVGGGIIQLLNIVIAWRAHHAQALDREDGQRRVDSDAIALAGVLSREVQRHKGFTATLSWEDGEWSVIFPGPMPSIGMLITFHHPLYDWTLRVINHEWHARSAKAEVTIHCEVVEKRPTALQRAG